MLSFSFDGEMFMNNLWYLIMTDVQVVFPNHYNISTRVYGSVFSTFEKSKLIYVRGETHLLFVCYSRRIYRKF